MKLPYLSSYREMMEVAHAGRLQLIHVERAFQELVLYHRDLEDYERRLKTRERMVSAACARRTELSLKEDLADLRFRLNLEFGLADIRGSQLERGTFCAITAERIWEALERMEDPT